VDNRTARRSCKGIPCMQPRGPWDCGLTVLSHESLALHEHCSCIPTFLLPTSLLTVSSSSLQQLNLGRVRRPCAVYAACRRNSKAIARQSTTECPSVRLWRSDCNQMGPRKRQDSKKTTSATKETDSLERLMKGKLPSQSFELQLENLHVIKHLVRTAILPGFYDFEVRLDRFFFVLLARPFWIQVFSERKFVDTVSCRLFHVYRWMVAGAVTFCRS
jgi:hypothetical protein